MPRPLLAGLFLAAGLFAASAAAAATTFYANLSGAAEAPPNASPGTGWARITLLDPNTMRFEASFSDLIGTSTIAHIHAPTALPGTGTAAPATVVPSFPGFPSGVTSGTYDQTFGLLSAATYNPAFVTASGGTVAGARTAFLASLEGGTAYFNVHSSEFGGGEVRGFFSAIPEPETWTLMIAGFGLLGAALRRRTPVAT